MAETTGVEDSARPKAAMLLIVTNDRLLMHHRDDKPGVAHPGCLAGFGDAIEAGETVEEALQSWPLPGPAQPPADYAGWMGGTVIRAARVADASQIAVVHVRSWQGAYRGLMPQAYLDGLDPAQRVGRWERSLAEANDGRDGVLVADDSGTLLGFVGYSPSRDGDLDPARVGEIDAIYLLPSAWGKGVGRRLMGAALTRLAEARFDQVTLWVLDSNVRARRFYEAGGWLADGARKTEESRGFPIAQVRYKRSLTPSGTGPALSRLCSAA